METPIICTSVMMTISPWFTYKYLTNKSLDHMSVAEIVPTLLSSGGDSDTVRSILSRLSRMNAITYGHATVKDESPDWHRKHNKNNHVDRMNEWIGGTFKIVNKKRYDNGYDLYDRKSKCSFAFSPHVLEDIVYFDPPIPTGKSFPAGSSSWQGK